MENNQREHHLTGKMISGYGFDNFKKVYNMHTLNETAERGDHILPSKVSSLIELEQYLADLKKVKPVEETPEPAKKESVVQKVTKAFKSKKK